MPKKSKLTIDEVAKVASLANLPIPPEELEELQQELSKILDFVGKLQKVETNSIKETSQVTGLENVFREDEVNSERILSQADALANAKETHNGFFKVPKVTWT